MAAPAEFDGMALRSVGADMRDDCESDVLCTDADRRGAVDRNAHALRLLLPQSLRHQHVRDLRRSDSEGIGAEGAVGRRMAVAADNKQPGQGQALARDQQRARCLAAGHAN